MGNMEELFVNTAVITLGLVMCNAILRFFGANREVAVNMANWLLIFPMLYIGVPEFVDIFFTNHDLWAMTPKERVFTEIASVNQLIAMLAAFEAHGLLLDPQLTPMLYVHHASVLMASYICSFPYIHATLFFSSAFPKSPTSFSTSATPSKN